MSGKNRISSLDVLRGLMASGIMVYHNYVTFIGNTEADTLIEKIGVYGVSIFYVLSGLTLYVVYKESLDLTFKSILSFFIRRIFRIYPLLWFTIFLTMFIKHDFHTWKIVMINLTGLFGLVFRTDYIAIGQWSIGNELVFYLTLPVFILLAKYLKPAFYFALLLSLAAGCYFCFKVLSVNETIAAQWGAYIHPLNQLCLFSGGILIGYIIQKKDYSKHLTAIRVLFFASILAFILYPSHGDSITIVTGFSRLAFLLLCFLICFSTYYQKFKVPLVISRFFTTLGEASYSVYLLHPLFCVLGKQYFSSFPPALIISLSIVATLVISYFVYTYLEKYFQKMGGKFVKFALTKKEQP